MGAWWGFGDRHNDQSIYSTANHGPPPCSGPGASAPPSPMVNAALDCVCVCVCERERERESGSYSSGVYSLSEIVLIAACLQTHTSIITVSVTWLCSPLGLELMVKLTTLLTVFTFILKAEASDYGKGRYISDAACGVRPITMHCASWPIRADCACRKEGLCRKRSVWERRGIEDLQ